MVLMSNLSHDEFVRTDEVMKELAAAYSDGYAAMVRRAGQLRQTLGEIGSSAPGYERGKLQFDAQVELLAEYLTAGNSAKWAPAHLRALEHTKNVAIALHKDCAAKLEAMK